MTGCQSVVTRLIPAGSSAALINSTSQEVIALIAQQQAECDAVLPPNNPPPLSPFFTNAEVFATLPCGECEAATYTGTLPWYLSIDPTNNHLVFATGVIAADTQAEADAAAQAFVNNFKAAAISAGKIVCTTCTITTSSPLPDATQGDPYSETLAVTGTVTTNVWTVSNGSLPLGLSLNSATGEISGTPTEEDVTYDFDITVTSGAQCCTKSFQLTVDAVSTDCPDWDTLLWDTPSIVEIDAGIAFFTPSNSANATGTATADISGLFNSQAQANNLATINYNGTGCNCKVTVTISNTLPASGNSSDGYIQVTRVLGFVNLLLEVDLAQKATGVYVYFFSLPDTSAVNEQFLITLQASGGFPTPSKILTIQADFANV
jgi:hypothetical protein